MTITKPYIVPITRMIPLNRLNIIFFSLENKIITLRFVTKLVSFYVVRTIISKIIKTTITIIIILA